MTRHSFQIVLNIWQFQNSNSQSLDEDKKSDLGTWEKLSWRLNLTSAGGYQAVTQRSAQIWNKKPSSQVLICAALTDHLGRHYICRQNYTTSVFGAKVLHINRDNGKFMTNQRKCFKMPHLWQQTQRCFKTTFMTHILRLTPSHIHCIQLKRGKSLLLTLVTKFLLKGACQVKRWPFVRKPVSASYTAVWVNICTIFTHTHRYLHNIYPNMCYTWVNDYPSVIHTWVNFYTFCVMTVSFFTRLHKMCKKFTQVCPSIHVLHSGNNLPKYNTYLGKYCAKIV